ncbi:MAG: siderophore ABC transporter substrate-binding protein [Pseudomonadota bacterium]
MLRNLLVLFSLVCGLAQAQTVNVDTYRGMQTVERGPGVTVVLDIAALDSLDALGVSVQGVLSNYFIDYIRTADRDAALVGTAFEPDYEAIFALGPDLVIAGGRSAGAVDDLSRIAPTIDMTIWEHTIDQGLARLTALGQIFGKEQLAAQLTSDFLNKLNHTRELVKGQGKALVLMTNGPKVSAYGAGGRFGWLHTALDLPQAVEEVEAATHGEAVSFEFIRESDPDILIVIDRLSAIGQDGDSAFTTLDNVLVKQTKAWRDNKVVFIPSGPIYIAGGGIQAMNKILDQIIEQFDPQ